MLSNGIDCIHKSIKVCSLSGSDMREVLLEQRPDADEVRCRSSDCFTVVHS